MFRIYVPDGNTIWWDWSATMPSRGTHGGPYQKPSLGGERMSDPSSLLPPDVDLVIVSRDYGVIYIRDEISVQFLELILDKIKAKYREEARP
ncbi:MAG: hypothetical protein QXT77_05945 [Candidatus Methanomethylicaceae archaeon]